MARYIVTRRLPDKVTYKNTTVDGLRKAGQHVAYCLADNANVSKSEATRLAMEFERYGCLESHGYIFELNRVS
jgi:hypothetical protein